MSNRHNTALEAKATAKELAGALGSLAHALWLADEYPNREGAQQYVTSKSPRVVLLAERLIQQYKDLDIPIGEGFAPGLDPREEAEH